MSGSGLRHTNSLRHPTPSKMHYSHEVSHYAVVKEPAVQGVGPGARALSKGGAAAFHERPKPHHETRKSVGGVPARDKP